MKNQPSAGEQLILLQNISYVKQFMQRGSLKVLFLVNLLLTISSGLFINSFKGVYKTVFDFLINNYNVDIDISAEGILDLILNISTISTVAFGLILPITLLYIIIRSKSENPSVVPSGAVKFLYVLSFMQSISAILSAVVMLVMQFFSIFAADNIVDAIISFAVCAIGALIFSAYYILQTKFLGAIKHSCTGFSLIYGSSKGFGVLSALTAVCSGIISAISVVMFIVLYSMFSSNNIDKDPSFNKFLEIGGKELFDSLKPVAIIFIIITVLYTLYNIFLAVVAFGYRETVAEAINNSFISSKNASTSINSAFRTYGGNSSYSNYNYTSSTAKGQQSYATTNNTTVKKEENTVKNNINNNVNTEASVDANFNPYNNQPDSFNNTYEEPISGNGSFIPKQEEFQNNNIYNEPINMNGSFGMQQDFQNNNIYNEPVNMNDSFEIPQDFNNNY